jgi:hypothetical protein
MLYKSNQKIIRITKITVQTMAALRKQSCSRLAFLFFFFPLSKLPLIISIPLLRLVLEIHSPNLMERGLCFLQFCVVTNFVQSVQVKIHSQNNTRPVRLALSY